MDSELWESSQVFKEYSCFACAGSSNRCYSVIGHCWERRALLKYGWYLVVSDMLWLFRPGRAQRLWSPKESEPRLFRARVWVWRYVSLSQSYVAHTSATPDGLGEGVCKVALPKEVAIPMYSVFVDYVYLRYRAYAPRGCHGLLYHMYLILLCYHHKEAVAFDWVESFAVVKMPATDSGKHWAEQDIHGTWEPMWTTSPKKVPPKEVKNLLRFLRKTLLSIYHRINS